MELPLRNASTHALQLGVIPLAVTSLEYIYACRTFGVTTDAFWNFSSSFLLSGPTLAYVGITSDPDPGLGSDGDPTILPNSSADHR